MINSKQHGVQNSGPWDPWLHVVENSRLFAQRGHSARCAPIEFGLLFVKDMTAKFLQSGFGALLAFPWGI